MIAAQFGEFGARRLKAALVAIDGGDACAGPGETERGGTADTAASARHHTNAA